MKTKCKLSPLLSIILLCGILQTSAAADTAVVSEDGEPTTIVNSDKTDSPIAAEREKTLRIEFKISGTDCPVCLGRIQGKIKALKGVKKAVVWTWPPYFGLVIYEANVLNWADVEKSIADEHVRLIEVTKNIEPKTKDAEARTN